MLSVCCQGRTKPIRKFLHHSPAQVWCLLIGKLYLGIALRPQIPRRHPHKLPGFDRMAGTKHPKSRAHKATLHWDDREVALIFNWSDYCLRNGLGYQATIEQEVLKVKRKDGSIREEVTYRQISDKLCYALKNRPSIPTFLKEGTQCLGKRHLRDHWLREMNTQRREWGFEPIGQLRATASQAKGGVDVASSVEVKSMR